jgi:hypothetical protein
MEFLICNFLATNKGKFSSCCTSPERILATIAQHQRGFHEFTVFIETWGNGGEISENTMIRIYQYLVSVLSKNDFGDYFYRGIVLDSRKKSFYVFLGVRLGVFGG